MTQTRAPSFSNSWQMHLPIPWAPPVTTAVTKDRVTGHNPLAAVYLAQGYYNKKFYPADPAELNPHDTEYNR